MIAALDVFYDEVRSRGTGTALLFRDWLDSAPAAEYAAVVENVAPYVPGEFYRRELPCLLAVIGAIKETVDVLVVDSYVRLNDKPGLGQHLFDHLRQKIPVIGVAKSHFLNAPATEILRGTSQSPLYVTAIGIDPEEAADCIRKMHGPYRLPTLLKRVDRLGREEWTI